MIVNAFPATGTVPFQLQHDDAAMTFLTPGKSLNYRVFAENGAGERSLPSSENSQSMVDYSMTQSTKPAPEPPGDPVWTGAVDARGMMHHYDEINLSWPAPEDSGTPTAYRVDVAETKMIGRTSSEPNGTPVRAWREQERDTRHSDPTYDHRGWRPKASPQTFDYRVFARDGGLYGEASLVSSQEVDGQTAPTQVQSVDTSVVSAKQINVSWAKPENDGGTAIVKYCLLSTTQSTLAMPGMECVAAVVTDNIERILIDAPTVGHLTEREPATMFMHGSESPSSALLAATTYRYRVYAINEAQRYPRHSADDIFTGF